MVVSSICDSILQFTLETRSHYEMLLFIGCRQDVWFYVAESASLSANLKDE